MLNLGDLRALYHDMAFVVKAFLWFIFPQNLLIFSLIARVVFLPFPFTTNLFNYWNWLSVLFFLQKLCQRRQSFSYHLLKISFPLIPVVGSQLSVKPHPGYYFSSMILKLTFLLPIEQSLFGLDSDSIVGFLFRYPFLMASFLINMSWFQLIVL